jgi:hypothetical protein
VAINIHIDGMTGIDIFADVGSLDKRQIEAVPHFVGDYESARVLWLNKVRAESVWTVNLISAREAILQDRIENHS